MTSRDPIALTADAAAKVLGLAPSTLAKLRLSGDGPACFDIALDGEWQKVSGASPGNRVGTVVLRLQLNSIGISRSAVMLNGEPLASGRGAIVCAAARKLVKRGYDSAELCEVWRGKTLCLCGPLGSFARVTVEDGPDGRPRFRPYRERFLGVLSPVVQSAQILGQVAGRPNDRLPL
jgi:hypothetical protein